MLYGVHANETEVVVAGTAPDSRPGIWPGLFEANTLSHQENQQVMRSRHPPWSLRSGNDDIVVYLLDTAGNLKWAGTKWGTAEADLAKAATGISLRAAAALRSGYRRELTTCWWQAAPRAA